MTTFRPLLLVDACDLIDYATTSRSVLKLVSRHVGKLHVTSTVFREVTQIRSKDAKRWGLTIVEPTLDTLAQAAIAKGRLSSEDRLAVAMSKEFGFTCVSNDNQLRLECDRQGVPVLWGLELLVHPVEAGGISAAKAGSVGTSICGANKWLGPDVLARLLGRIALHRRRGVANNIRCFQTLRGALRGALREALGQIEGSRFGQPRSNERLQPLAIQQFEQLERRATWVLLANFPLTNGGQARVENGCKDRLAEFET